MPRQSRQSLRAFALALALMAPGARCARAATVTIPLTIDYETLTAALKHQLYVGPGGRADFWNGADACQYLYGTYPRFFQRSGTLEFETSADLSLGIGVGGNRVAPVGWSGLIDVDLQGYIGGDLVIRFRATDLNLYKPDHEKSLLVGRGFDLIKGNLIPRLETFSYDLRPALDQLRTLAQMAAAPDAAATISHALAGLRPLPAVVPEADSLRVTLELAVPTTAPTPTVSSAPLSQADLAAWQTTLDNWDAFMVFAIEQMGGTVADPAVRQQLLDVLLDGRYRLVAALSQPQPRSGPDPVRLLFLDEWSRFRDIVRSAAAQGLLKDRALEFLSFISAGDALFALDQAAPALGLRISADDLRRLARVMAPQFTADPLAFSYDEDPALQKMFGVMPPLETPGPLALPSAPAEPRTPTATATPQSHSDLEVPSWWGAAPADAAEASLTTQLYNLGMTLKGVVVNAGNVVDYKRAIQSLLNLAATYVLGQSDPSPAIRQPYLLIVKSAAWQESCWRQFVRRDGRVRFLESSSGDIGLMQVNKHIWRGFYSLPRLEWDIVYNASAGDQILKRLMDSEIARNAGRAQSAAVARSVYAAYNGGPAAHDRWRRAHETSLERQIDQAFWQKYQAVRAGQSFDILDCATHWSTTPGH